MRSWGPSPFELGFRLVGPKFLNARRVGTGILHEDGRSGKPYSFSIHGTLASDRFNAFLTAVSGGGWRPQSNAAAHSAF